MITCACGCGRITEIRHGRANRYIKGHNNSNVIRPLGERFWEKVNKDGPIPTHRPELGQCWEWIGARNKRGYGRIGIGRHTVKLAHCVGYELQIGPIALGLQHDHLCRNRACVRGSHIEPVTPRINTIRGESPAAQHSRQTECKRGHPLSGDNLYVEPNGARRCRACKRAVELAA